jgi:hypothetical protein
VNVSQQQLEGAPKYGKYENWDWSDRSRGQSVTTITASVHTGVVTVSALKIFATRNFAREQSVIALGR